MNSIFIILESLLDTGTIYINGSIYIGIASDGVEVQLGNVGEEKQVEEYLKERPSPTQW